MEQQSRREILPAGREFFTKQIDQMVRNLTYFYAPVKDDTELAPRRPVHYGDIVEINIDRPGLTEINGIGIFSAPSGTPMLFVFDVNNTPGLFSMLRMDTWHVDFVFNLYF